ncbi:aldo/keto reductase [Nocardia sp. CA-107356]|uniref:aldo/keto reductase n=1 Tax=Nocardia sp. CA-107356 TaxID=3239972 RepID=UPI003D8D06B7
MGTSGTAFDRPGGTASLADRPVGRIGYGAMQLVAHRPGESAVDREVAIEVLRHATDRGVNHIDTAQFYGSGACNELIRAALRPYPDDHVIVSKIGADNDADGGLVAAQRPEQLREQVEENLATLGIDRIPVVNLRRLDAPPGILAEGAQLVDLDSQLAVLLALRDQGKIGAIGLSNVSAEQLRGAVPAGIACVQNMHNPLDRSTESVLDACREHDIAWVPYFPLGSAFPGLPKVGDHPEVGAIAAGLHATPAQVVLAWHLAHYAHTLLIPGTTSIRHLDENIAAGHMRLGPDAMTTLNRLAETPAPA